MDLGQTIEYWSQKRAKECALIYDGQKISYDELNRSINRVANGLSTLGISEGDRVALMLPNIPEFVYTFYACQKLGAIAVPFNTMYKGKEITHILKDSGAKAIVCLTNFVPLINEIQSELPDLKHIITTGERTLTLADPESTLFIQALLTKGNFAGLDDAYRKIGAVLEQFFQKLGIKEAWYRHRGSVRCKGKKIGGFFISEIEDMYIVNSICFTGQFQPNDFFYAIWVPPEVKDKMLEPLTSISEELGTCPDDGQLKKIIVTCFEREFNVQINTGTMTREEQFGYEKQRNLMGKSSARGSSSNKSTLLKKITLFFSGKKQ